MVKWHKKVFVCWILLAVTLTHLFKEVHPYSLDAIGKQLLRPAWKQLERAATVNQHTLNSSVVADCHGGNVILVFCIDSLGHLAGGY